MKIGIFDPYLDSLSGGEKYMLTAASCLALNHDVFVFWDDKTVLEQAHKKFGIDISHVHLADNIFSSQVSFLQRLKETQAYDAIFYLSDGSIPFVAAKKLFLHFQFPVEWVHGQSWKNSLKMKRVSGVICNSLFTKNHIDTTFDINSIIIYPPSSGEQTIINAKKENVILSVGRFAQLSNGTTFKKQEFMIAIFKKLIDAGLQDWKLILVISFLDRDREHVQKITELAKGYPIDILTNVVSAELDHVYAKAKIYWHAAGFEEDVKRHPELAEHFGIATVQAMEQGAVPVVIDAGGQKEIVENGKNGFLWSSEKECIEKTQVLMQDETLWKKLSEEAKKKSKIFSKEEFCKKVNEIIH